MAALEGLERMLDERLKLLQDFVEFLKKQAEKKTGKGVNDK